MVHGQMDNHCRDTHIFNSQEGRSLHRGYSASPTGPGVKGWGGVQVSFFLCLKRQATGG